MLKGSIELIEWLKDNGSKYILHIIVIISLYGNYYLFNGYNSLTIENETIKLRLVDFQGCRTTSPFGDAPLQVTFIDGNTAYVNTFHTIIPSNISVQTKEEFMEAYLPKYESILQSVKSAIFSELEKVELKFARTHRKELVEKILSKLQPTLEVNGFHVNQFELLEFCNVGK